MTESTLEFEWNPDKAKQNEARHQGVTFQEAATVFDDSYALVYLDECHGTDEPRQLIIGLSNHNRLLFVSFVERRPNLIRIISARRVTPQERKKYEKADQA